jgi:hypothetical protein
MTALRPMVLAWLKTGWPSTPKRRAPSTTGAAGSVRLEGTFVTSMRPPRTETTSVNVPPASTPSIRRSP